MVGLAQLVSASGCGPEGRGFESHISPQQKSLICLPDKLGFFELSVPQAEREVCFASEAHFVREVCLTARYAEHLTSPLRRSNFTMPQGITSLRLAATSLKQQKTHCNKLQIINEAVAFMKRDLLNAGSHKEVQFNLIRRKQRLTPTDFNLSGSILLANIKKARN